MAKEKYKKRKKWLITFISVILVLGIIIAVLNLLSLQNLLKKVIHITLLKLKISLFLKRMKTAIGISQPMEISR